MDKNGLTVYTIRNIMDKKGLTVYTIRNIDKKGLLYIQLETWIRKV